MFLLEISIISYQTEEFPLLKLAIKTFFATSKVIFYQKLIPIITFFDCFF